MIIGRLRTWVGWFAAVGLLLVSCSYFATNQTPRVFNPGEYCVGVGVSSFAVSATGGWHGRGQVYARAGIGHDIDVGMGYASPLGVRLDLKRQFLREPLLVAASLEASYDYRATGRSYPTVDPHFIGLHPLFIFGNDNIWGGARSIFQVEITDSGDTRFHAYPGLFVGGAYGIGIDELRVLPEAALYVDPGLDHDRVLFYPSGGLSIQIDFWKP